MAKAPKKDPTEPVDPWKSATNELRKRKQTNMTLLPETLDGLAALGAAMGAKSRSQVVEFLVENELRRKRIKTP